jgi:hypothetical protein
VEGFGAPGAFGEQARIAEAVLVTKVRVGARREVQPRVDGRRMVGAVEARGPEPFEADRQVASARAPARPGEWETGLPSNSPAPMAAPRALPGDGIPARAGAATGFPPGVQPPSDAIMAGFVSWSSPR